MCWRTLVTALTLTTSLLLAACQEGGATPSLPALAPAAAAAEPTPGAAAALESPQRALLVDVRTPGEFASGHLPGAVNIPVGALGRRLGELGPKGAEIAVYCRSGSRSAHAARLLEGAGFTRVTDLGSLDRAARHLRRAR